MRHLHITIDGEYDLDVTSALPFPPVRCYPLERELRPLDFYEDYWDDT